MFVILGVLQGEELTGVVGTATTKKRDQRVPQDGQKIMHCACVVVACDILSAPRTDTMISFSRLFRAQNSVCMCQLWSGEKKHENS